MVKPGIRPQPNPLNSKIKHELIVSAHKRVSYAINKGFHIEAIALLESIMADRLESAIYATKPEISKKNSLGALIKSAEEMKVLETILADELRNWNDARSKVIHEMVKLNPAIDSTWKERTTFAKETAESGKELYRKLDKVVKRIKQKAS